MDAEEKRLIQKMNREMGALTAHIENLKESGERQEDNIQEVKELVQKLNGTVSKTSAEFKRLPCIQGEDSPTAKKMKKHLKEHKDEANKQASTLSTSRLIALLLGSGSLGAGLVELIKRLPEIISAWRGI